MPIATIVGAVAVVGPAQVSARLVQFAAQDKLTTALAGRIATIVFPLAVLLLIVFPHSVVALFVFAAAYGAANGAVTIVRGTAVPDFMWREGYGAINGALTFIDTLHWRHMWVVAALIWAAGGNYDGVLWAIFGAGCVATLAFWHASTTRNASREA